MPTPRTVGSYSTHLVALVEGVLTTGQPALLDMDSEKEANRIRLQIYGLKGALKATENHPLSQSSEKLTITRRGTLLTVSHVDFNVPSQIITAGGL